MKARREQTAPVVSLVEAMLDPQLFGAQFGGESWAGWRSILRGLFALSPEGEADRDTFAACTGRSTWPTTPFREGWFLVGRRGGKSRIGALLATYIAAFHDFSAQLAPGERGTIAIIAADRRQARVILNYTRALFSHPLLKGLVEGERVDGLDMRNNVSIEVFTCSFRTSRGYTLLAAVLDEVSFWRDDSSLNPDAEVVGSLRPAMATIPSALLLGLTTPYARNGVAFAMHERHFAKDNSPVLVVRAPTRTLNPTVSPHVIVEALAEDESAARSEYLAEFRCDLESFVDRGIVERAVVAGRIELPPRPGVRYAAFVDPSGGRADSFACCLAHREPNGAVIDALREWKAPFSPDSVVAKIAALCRSYGLVKLTGDRYGATWTEERFAAHGMRYERSPLSKSDLYASLLPQLNSGRVELLDFPGLVAQLAGLERRTARGTGRDSIDHAPGGRDDIANVLAGCVHLVAGRSVARAHTFELDQLFRGTPAWWPRDWPESWHGQAGSKRNGDDYLDAR